MLIEADPTPRVAVLIIPLLLIFTVVSTLPKSSLPTNKFVIYAEPAASVVVLIVPPTIKALLIEADPPTPSVNVLIVPELDIFDVVASPTIPTVP